MKLNTKKTIFVGFAFLLIQLFWQVYDNVIAKMLIDSFGLNQFASGIVMAFDNILAVILLPVFGALSDKTKSKHGKRTPYIFIGTIVAALLITGVSIFDNLQNKKIQEAGIPGIETVEVEKIEEDSIIYCSGYNADGSEIIVTISKQELVNNEEIKSLYKFDFNNANAKYFLEKEHASNAREPFIAEIRDQNIGFLVGFLGVLLIVLIAMSAFRTPAVSLMPDVTPKPLRSKGNAIINLMGAAGGIIALVYMTFTNKDYHSYSTTFIVLSVLMIIFLLIFLFNVKENKLVAERIEEEKLYGISEEDKIEEVAEEKMPKDVKISFILILLSVVFWYMAYNAATSKFSVYATTVLDTGYTMPLLVAQGAAIVSYIPIGIISSKIGRKKTVIAGVIILIAAFFLAIFVSKNTAILIWVALALAGIGWATINVNSYPMIVEMATGNNVGKYTGIYYTASMAAQIATPVLSGLFMDIFGMRYTLFIYSTIFSALALVTMLFVKHGDSKPIPKDSLSTFEDLGD